MFQVKNLDTRQRQRLLSGAFTVNFEQIPHIFLVFWLLTLNKLILTGLPK